MFFTSLMNIFYLFIDCHLLIIFYHIYFQFAALSGIDVVPADISVAGRVLAAFPEKLKEHQRVADNLSYLGEWAQTPEANIVKLPNISAPLNQLEDCIKELRGKGYDVPLYPREPSSADEEDVKRRYDALMGSAVRIQLCYFLLFAPFNLKV